jgi:hypothetical protein
LQWKWWWKYRKPIKVVANQALLMGQFRLLNAKGDIIPL